MLSWASYLFGSGTSELQPAEASTEPKAMETSDTHTKPEPEQEWVVVDYAGRVEQAFLIPCTCLFWYM